MRAATPHVGRQSALLGPAAGRCVRSLQPASAPSWCSTRLVCRCSSRSTSNPGDTSGGNGGSPSERRGRRSSRSSSPLRSTPNQPDPTAPLTGATPGRRRRRSTTALSNGERQPGAQPDAAAAEAAAAPAAAPAAAAPARTVAASDSSTQTDDAAGGQGAAAAAKNGRPPRITRATSAPHRTKQQQQHHHHQHQHQHQQHQQQQQDQQQQPPNIEYTLNSSVGSYSDLNTCTVNWDTQSPSSSNGGGSSGPSGSYSDQACDAVRGLIYGATVRFSDSAALRLRRRAMVVWEESGPQRVLIVKKPVEAASATLRQMADWLQRHKIEVFVERSVHATEFPDLAPFDPAATRVDFAITLGGDGTVLHLASLFAEDVPLPPVMCFAMGTLGFLTPFDAAQFRSCLARVLAANRKPLFCTLRTRKRCAVLDADGQVRRVHHILNECVVDRGAFPSSVYLEVFIDGAFVTAAEADGLIIATPSGSTAYSMSAGGAMVAPSVPCTLITPLSPHSLSFRPLIVPENAALSIRLPDNARSHARASFDGKHPMRIARGHSVHFQTSLCPLPLINIGSLDTDWYEGITRKLKWNQSIRGVPGVLDAALLQQAAAAAAAGAGAVGLAHAPAPAAGSLAARPLPLEPQGALSLGGLVSSLATAAANEAKVANWVEEALLPGAGGVDQ